MKSKKYALYAWLVLLLNLVVIVLGAYVRATGSGAGCGNHWPLCNGAIIPLLPSTETIIEFSHRLISGLDFLAVIILFVWAMKIFPKGSVVRKASFASLVFILAEVLLGAGLVLFELVADNDSLMRAIVIACHLCNTLFLLAFLTLTAHFASGGPPPEWRISSKARTMSAFALLLLIALSVTGAIVALGDTLFPSDSLIGGFQGDLSSSSHFLIRLRIVHPILAGAAFMYLLYFAAFARKVGKDPFTSKFATLVSFFLILQIAIGLLNLFLLAPIWLQLIHLLQADLLWIALVLLITSLLSKQPTQ